MKARIWASELYAPHHWYHTGQPQGWNTGSCFIFYDVKLRANFLNIFKAWQLTERNLWVIYACCHSYLCSTLLSSFSLFFLAKKMQLHIVIASGSNKMTISTLLLLFSIVWKGSALLIIPFNRRAQTSPGVAARSQWVSTHCPGRETWFFWLVFCQQGVPNHCGKLTFPFPSHLHLCVNPVHCLCYLLNEFVFEGGVIWVYIFKSKCSHKPSYASLRRTNLEPNGSSGLKRLSKAALWSKMPSPTILSIWKDGYDWS